MWRTFLLDQIHDADFDMDVEYVLEVLEKQEYCCAITEIPLKCELGDFRSASINRIDPSRGYVYGNIQIICQAISRMKSDGSQNDAIAFLEEIGLDWTKEQRLLVYSDFGQFVCSLIGEMRKLIPDQFRFANIPMVINGTKKGPRKLGWQFVYAKGVVNAVEWGNRLPTIYFWEDRMEIDTTGIPNSWAEDVPGSVLMYNDPEFCAQKACDMIIGRIIRNDPILEQYASTNPDPKYYHDISLPNYPSKTYTVPPSWSFADYVKEADIKIDGTTK